MVYKAKILYQSVVLFYYEFQFEGFTNAWVIIVTFKDHICVLQRKN